MYNNKPYEGMNETKTLTQTHLHLVLYFFIQQLVSVLESDRSVSARGLFTVCITPLVSVCSRHYQPQFHSREELPNPVFEHLF